MFELTAVVALLAGCVLLLAVSARLVLRGRKRTEQPVLPPRHLKHRDPYAPLHRNGWSAQEWLCGEDDHPPSD